MDKELLNKLSELLDSKFGTVKDEIKELKAEVSELIKQVEKNTLMLEVTDTLTRVEKIEEDLSAMIKDLASL